MHRILLKTLLFLLLLIASTQVKADRHKPSTTYRNFCSSCHGLKGDGFGKASRYLFPKPRDFRASPLQYATSINRIASSRDILHVVKNGISNSSMNGWSDLTDVQLKEVVQDVLSFRLEGARERYYFAVSEDTGESAAGTPSISTANAGLSAYLSQNTVAGPKWLLANPKIGDADLNQGKLLYQTQNCHKCHGVDGRGSYGIDLTGEFGYPAFARNLVQESYKYGSEQLDVARTIRLGIAGTKMPGSPTLTDEQLLDLSHYVLSLKDEETIETTNNERYRRAIGVTLQRK